MIVHEYTGNIALDAATGQPIPGARIYKVMDHDLNPVPTTVTEWSDALTAQSKSGDCAALGEGACVDVRCRVTDDVVEFIFADLHQSLDYGQGFTQSTG